MRSPEVDMYIQGLDEVPVVHNQNNTHIHNSIKGEQGNMYAHIDREAEG
jgi:hypothetical protein